MVVFDVSLGSLLLGFLIAMASENGHAPRMAFRGESFPFPHVEGDQSGQRLRPSGFAAVEGDKTFSGGRDARFFHDLHRRPLPAHSWGGILDGRSQCGDGPHGDGEEDEDEDGNGDDEDEDVDDGDGLVSLEEGNNKVNYNSSGSVQSSSEKMCDDRAISQEHHSSFGLSRGLLKDASGGRGCLGEQSYQEGRMDGCQTAVVDMETEPYYTNVLPGADGSSHSKDVRGENGCTFSARREVGLAAGYWETLRTHLSDPITGALMDDAMMLPCGHTFGSIGMQHVYKMKACYTCSQPISEYSSRPNLTLRAAVQAFRREDELHLFKASRRKRDKFDQEKCSHHDSFSMDLSRGKGVQFPFAVSDRVIIKGNKRTPQRFVGRVAIVTTQCLNGWYVVKTLDNAESVKLQYRSLEKLMDDQGPNIILDKTQTPNWL